MISATYYTCSMSLRVFHAGGRLLKFYNHKILSFKLFSPTFSAHANQSKLMHSCTSLQATEPLSIASGGMERIREANQLDAAGMTPAEREPAENMQIGRPNSH
jgi:hypothetical protein